MQQRESEYKKGFLFILDKPKQTIQKKQNRRRVKREQLNRKIKYAVKNKRKI